SAFSVLPKSKSNSFDVVDVDRDIDIDIVVGQESSPSGYLENLGHGRFRFREFENTTEQYQNLNYLKVAEVDGNRSWDFIGLAKDGPSVLATTETTASSLAAELNLQFSCGLNHQAVLQDFNNDGFTDALFFGSDSLLMLGDGLSMVPNPNDLLLSILDCDYCDFDGDGLLDLVAISGDGQKVEILLNATNTDNGWAKIQLCGINSNFPKGRVNNHAIGTFVEAKIGDRYYATTVTRPWIHVGLGDHKKIDLMRFLWTSGMPQSLFGVDGRQVIYEEMFEKGSCPYLYTWNGSDFTFFSDCLWAAPLGLQSAPGKFIPCRNWEYLKIPGKFLEPKGGKYVIQLTEELREAAYFDLVELYAVDHPADVEVFTNEKVGPPSIAQHKIHCVRTPRLPVSAKDMYGNDVLADISKKDQVYFKGFNRRIAKGLAPLHYIELDLGDLKTELDRNPVGASFTLFLHGWIRPTDCSLNISFSQNPNEPSPVPPVVLVGGPKSQMQKNLHP
ncbi:MAG: VCBS repeat-containing protein, partial [Planctomycetota bacterium]|nr:VCBS repeat-containing protein [Planctomycetota bacterium]